MMETLTDRVTRYLLRRIRRLAVLDLYQHAAVAGLLDELTYDAGSSAGPALISRRAPTVELMHLLSLGNQGKQILSRRLGHAGRYGDSLVEHWQFSADVSGTRSRSSDVGDVIIGVFVSIRYRA